MESETGIFLITFKMADHELHHVFIGVVHGMIVAVHAADTFDAEGVHGCFQVRTEVGMMDVARLVGFFIVDEKDRRIVGRQMIDRRGVFNQFVESRIDYVE